MRYVANPVEVDAFKILEVGPVEGNRKVLMKCSEGKNLFATFEMLQEVGHIEAGDYFVYSHGNAFLAIKSVFEEKYRAVMP